MSNYDEIFEKNFDKIRSQQAYVEEEDASRKSSIDSRIVELVNAINTSDNYFTTSSCSGRFITYAQVYFYSMIEKTI
jgi:tRNA wybutosine-synthesizing protein 3